MYILISLLLTALFYWLPVFIFRLIYKKPIKNKLLALVICCVYFAVIHTILMYIIYGYVPSGTIPWLWLILDYYYLIAKRPLFTPKPPMPEPPKDWREY